MAEKKKMDDFTKFKLVYCGELLLFAIIFGVLGVLFLLQIIPIKSWKFWVFPIVTLLGGIWLVIDLIWTIKSPAKRAKNSLIDKILPAPMAVSIVAFDIYILINNIMDVSKVEDDGYKTILSIAIGIALSYYCLVYLFESIYHWYVPAKALTNAYDEALKQMEAEAAKEKLSKKLKK